ncbi:helix-turn-helix domain-containing protein [Paracoccus homiensis]|uniref:helix-turn-helix domain-containing protein n=1 Tax=Paracoccus homiensis TaxID=364199 RepID=UPI001C311C11|nr:helix-turn-helix domain-containing protein [Paracoccus homiensis]
MEPALLIISRLGGVARVASLRGIHRSAVWKWTQPRSKGGTDGRIPIEHIRPLLEETRRLELGIKAEDFLPADEAPPYTARSAATLGAEA